MRNLPNDSQCPQRSERNERTRRSITKLSMTNAWMKKTLKVVNINHFQAKDSEGHNDNPVWVTARQFHYFPLISFTFFAINHFRFPKIFKCFFLKINHMFFFLSSWVHQYENLPWIRLPKWIILSCLCFVSLLRIYFYFSSFIFLFVIMKLIGSSTKVAGQRQQRVARQTLIKQQQQQKRQLVLAN